MVISWWSCQQESTTSSSAPKISLPWSGRPARTSVRSWNDNARASSLASASGQDDASVAREQKVSLNTVANVRRRFVAAARKEPAAGPQSVCRAVQAKRKARVLDGRAEAHLVALVCAGPPAGRKVWTMHLLAGRLMEARVVDSVTGETVRQTLKKMRSSPG